MILGQRIAIALVVAGPIVGLITLWTWALRGLSEPVVTAGTLSAIILTFSGAILGTATAG